MKSIKEIEQLLKNSDREEDYIKTLRLDERKGVQKALGRWEKQIEKREALLEKYELMQKYEKLLNKEGYRLIAGIDEVGRGPLAGPVVAAAVILPENIQLLGIDDSKKLSEERRLYYYERIMEEATAVSTCMIDHHEIDTMNILEASKKAMIHAVNSLHTQPDFLLIDAVKLPTPYPSESIIKGDSKSISIAAASVVAKVERDRLMKDYDKQFPDYGFAKNMGYGTKEHLRAIEEKGISPIHRRSFAPVKDYLIDNRR
ncbi:ribonuclease HII [Cytobacillus sp. FSL R7-0680]|uniref:ribonuclease HII n=1 Tax=Cytobacillus sp. FSL R7-0680 TaxID=2921689 RepID=UPI0030FA5979